MLYAVILAGGKGERFWPLSREVKPKQFLSLVGKESFLQDTFKRLNSGFPQSRIYVVTGSAYEVKVARQLPQLSKKNIISEPRGKNTAVCIGLAAHILFSRDPQAVIVTLPSDHIIQGNRKFLNTVSVAAQTAQRLNCLVAIGIKPRYGATGYGYLKLESKIKTFPSRQKSKKKIYKVERFVEKPNKSRAARFLNSGNYLWNSGIFVFKASVILEAINEHLPSLYRGLKKIDVKSSSYPRALRELYAHVKSVSIDYGVMEKAGNIYAVLGDFFWDDVGSWASIEKVRKKDRNGNIIIGGHKCLDTKNTTIICQDGHLIATLGVEDTIIVRARNATLVCSKDRAEDVKKLIKKLDKRYL